MGIATRTLHSQPHLEPSDTAAAEAAEAAGGGATQQQDQQRQQLRLRRALPSSATLARNYDNIDAMGARSSSSSAAASAAASKSAGTGCRAVRDATPGLACAACAPSACCMPALPRHLPRLVAAAGGGGQLSKVAAALASAPRFLLLDFRWGLGEGLAACQRAALHCLYSGVGRGRGVRAPSCPARLPQARAGPGRHRGALLCDPAPQAAAHGHPGEWELVEPCD